MQGSRTEALDELLRTLVRLWGHAAVANRLERLRYEFPLPLSPRSGRREGDKKRSKRRSALAYLEKIDVPVEKRDRLRELAARFDQRVFLPAVGDVRNFLERQGSHYAVIRARDALIPKIMELLAKAPDEDLDKIVSGESHFGPARLGPISDAIKETSALIRTPKE